jgi:hypothetical protein
MHCDIVIFVSPIPPLNWAHPPIPVLPIFHSPSVVCQPTDCERQLQTGRHSHTCCRGCRHKRGLQHTRDEGGGTKVGREGKKLQGRQKTSVPVGCASPPIRDGVILLPKLISYKLPLPTTTSSSLSLMIKKNGGRKAL